MASDASFLYSVRVTFQDAAVRAEFIAWLHGGHLQDVVNAGALDAELVELDLVELDRSELDRSEFDRAADAAGDAAIDTLAEVETRYHFASRAAFDAYAAGPAVALRAEGAAKFPPSRGITMTRGFAASRLRLTR